MFRITMLQAEDGDCLFVEVGPETSPLRILIDGGRASTKPRLRELLDRLPARPGPLIDVMVLTHVDADHIEGLLALIVDDSPLTVGDVWFNGSRHFLLATGMSVSPNAPAKTTSVESGVKVLSIRQGVDFDQAVRARQWPWNKAFNSGPAMTDGGKLPKVPLGKALLTLIGPPQKKLAAFAPEWAAMLEIMRSKELPTLKGRERPIPRADNVALIATQMDQPDRTKPNGTSIAFVLEFEGRRVLFAADAHPDDIIAALRAFDPTAERVHFDAIKVAHHGSARNNTSNLINALQSPLWLISTSGANHEHPDPEAIARIVLAPPRNKTIVFNYRSRSNEVWDNPELYRKCGYCTRYPNADAALVVNISSAAPTFG